MSDNNASRSAASVEYNWQQIMSLFDELSDVPEAERMMLIEAKDIDEPTRSKLKNMLTTLDHTISLLDTPIIGRVHMPSNWLSDEWVGKRLNQYQIDEVLHEGARAGVFSATQLEPVARKVAVKMVRPESSEEYRQLFRSEQRTLAKLGHPNIASIYTVEVSDEGLPFSVMELIEGTTLSKYCDNNALGLSKRLSLFLDICDAVSYAHQRGVLHRDLKSSNILVRSFEGKPTPTIIDFDIATDLNDKVEFPDDYIMGTPEYMSPEHVIDQNDIDIRADVYSLGMVFFTLLVGSIPFDRSLLTTFSLAQKLALIAEFETLQPSEHFRALSEKEKALVATSRAADVKEFQQQLTTGLDYIFLKATHKDRDMRYQSVAEFSTDIENFLANRPVAAHPKSMAYGLKKFIQRNTIPVGLATSIVILGLIFAVTVIDQTHQIKVETDRAEQEQLNAEEAAEVILEALNIAKPETANSIGRETVSELIDRAFERFRSSDGVSPEFRAKLLLKLADSFRHTENKEKAREVESMILDELESFSPQQQAEALRGVMIGVDNDANYEAVVEYAQGVERLAENFTITPKTLIDSLLYKAMALDNLSKGEEAARTLDRALIIYDVNGVNNLPQKARINTTAADLAVNQRRYQDAEMHYLDAIDLYTQAYGASARHVVHTKFSELDFLISVDHPRATSEYARAVLADAVRIWGSQSYAENLVLYHLATLLAKEGRFEGAKNQLSQNLVALKEQSLVKDQLNIASLAILSSVYIELGQLDEALDVSERSVRLVIQDSEDGPSHLPSFIAEIEMHYAVSLAAASKFEEALSTIESSIAFYFTNQTKQYPESLLVRSYIYAQTGQHDSADQDVQSALTFLMSSAAETTFAEKRTLLGARLMEQYIEHLRFDSPQSVTAAKQIIDQYHDELGGKSLRFPYSNVADLID